LKLLAGQWQPLPAILGGASRLSTGADACWRVRLPRVESNLNLSGLRRGIFGTPAAGPVTIRVIPIVSRANTEIYKYVYYLPSL